MNLVKKNNSGLVKDQKVLSSHKRPEVQKYLEEAVSLTVKTLEITTLQRDQHRVLRSLIRMACRINIWMGEGKKEFFDLVVELYAKCEADFLASSKKIPKKSSFHNSMKLLQ
jgi:hypothetical protein